MKWSKITLHTLRENPADAEMESHRLFVRGGFIKKLAPGIYSYGFLLLRSIRKFEEIIRQELAKVGAHEILMPMVQPAELWQESGRWPHMTELLKFKNKNQHDFCLGATHEEAVVDFVRNDIQSYRDLPSNIFQIQTKYRDEIRPRFGLMRGREFIMKDAYTFDRDREGALKNYDLMHSAYTRIFNRLGVKFAVVKADSGAIGGDQSHEFQVLADGGMDQLLICSECGYAGNVEIVPVAVTEKPAAKISSAMEKFATPNLKTIDDLAAALKVPAEDLVKSFFVKFQNEKGQWETATLLLPGDREVNLVKVKALLKSTSDVEPLSDSEVKDLTGALPGSCGPVNLKNRIIMDPLLERLPGFVVGANEDGFHLRNVVVGRDFTPTDVTSIAEAKGGDPCPQCQSSLHAQRGIEVGHIFYLGTKYSAPMGLKYLDQNGKAQIVEMGCYGVGVTRTLQALIEQNHDSDGMIWPRTVAPFDVHICLLDPKDPACAELANNIEMALESKNLSAFIDDRDERPGIKFKDSDLIGLPLRVVIGKKGVEKGEIELFIRASKQKNSVAAARAAEEIFSALENCP